MHVLRNREDLRGGRLGALTHLIRAKETTGKDRHQNIYAVIGSDYPPLHGS